MWRFLRNRRLILRLHYYLGTHILGASRGGPCDSTALVLQCFDVLVWCQNVIWQCCNIGTCEASRFDSNLNRPFRFDSKVMGRFENFRIGCACPLLIVLKRLRPLTVLSGTVYRLASSVSDHMPVLFNVFKDWNEESVVCTSLLFHL